MFEKKEMIINCEVCDTRKIKEEDYAAYENIILNAEVILVNERSKSILNQLPILINAEETLETEEEFQVVSANGFYELTAETRFPGKTLLTVNGSVVIRPGAEAALENLVGIYVNGSVRYPEGLASYLGKLSVNGSVASIPEGYVELDSEFEIDRYFSLRAKQDGRYLVEERVKLIDRDVDTAKLAAKNIHFRTKTYTVREELLEDTIGMFDENVKLCVVPAGYGYAAGDAVLDEVLLQKYGTVLYIDGNLRMGEGWETALERLEKLYVNGNLYLLKKQAAAFEQEKVECRNIVITKGRRICNKAMVKVDQALLDACPDGLEIANCGGLTVKEDAQPAAILEKLIVRNCGYLSCRPEQRSALELVVENVGIIHDGDGKEEGGMTPMDLLKKALTSKIVNAETHVM